MFLLRGSSANSCFCLSYARLLLGFAGLLVGLLEPVRSPVLVLARPCRLACLEQGPSSSVSAVRARRNGPFVMFMF